MTDLEQRIKEAAEKATPGEWRSPWLPGSKQKCAGVEAVGSHYIVIHIDKDGSYHPDTVEMWKRDCAYIALASPANILSLLAEKDAEIDRLRGLIVQGDGSCDHCGAVPAIAMSTSLCNECADGVARAESAERERDEWKRIAEEYRNPTSEAGDFHDECFTDPPRGVDTRCSTCKAYDALVK